MEIECISRPAVVSHDSTSNSEYDGALLRAIQDRCNELTHIPDTSDNKMLYTGSGQWEGGRTLPTVSYLNDNMPTTGYNYSFQTNKKCLTGERNELPYKTALANCMHHGSRRLWICSPTGCASLVQREIVGLPPQSIISFVLVLVCTII
jgi:hypothetical protein